MENLEVIQFLINQGADLLARDKNGMTPQALIDQDKRFSKILNDFKFSG